MEGNDGIGTVQVQVPFQDQLDFWALIFGLFAQHSNKQMWKERTGLYGCHDGMDCEREALTNKFGVNGRRCEKQH